MKKIMIITALLLSVVATSFAAPVKMIREDRVWEYNKHKLYVYGNIKIDEQYQMKFDGTETVNGKTYHKLVYTGDILFRKDSIIGGEYKFVDFEKKKNTDKRYYLMREENGKVYTYFQDDSSEPAREYLTYDFNLKAGECIYGPILGFCDPKIFEVDLEFVKEIVVEQVDEINIEGEKCKVQTFKNFGLKSAKKTATEGIGYNLGILPAVDGIDAIIYSRYSGGEGFTHLNRVYNDKGDVIYRGYDKMLGVNEMTADYSDPEIRVSEDSIRVSTEGNVGVTVWSMQGSKVAGAEGAGEVSVSTSGLVPGVYVVHAASADGRSATRKIVVK